MRPLSKNTELILSLYKEGKDKNQIYDIMNSNEATIITKQGISNAISRYSSNGTSNGNGKPTKEAKTITSNTPAGIKEIEEFYQPKIEVEPQFTNDELKYLKVALLAHIKAYKCKVVKDAASEVNMNMFMDLQKKLERLIR